MNSFHWPSSVQHVLLSIISIISFSIGFWPMPGFTHPAGEFYHQAIEAMQNKNIEQAESYLQQAITEFPAYADAHHLLGMIQYQRTQNVTTAIPALKQAVKLNPNFAQAHYDLGLLLLKQEQMDEAQQQLQQALIHLPRFLGSPINAGQNSSIRRVRDRQGYCRNTKRYSKVSHWSRKRFITWPIISCNEIKSARRRHFCYA